MDIPSARLRQQQQNRQRESPSPADRFLGPTPVSASLGEELDEDDLFSSNSPSSSAAGDESPSPSVVSRLTRIRSFAGPPPEGFGILAALPEEDNNPPSSLSRSLSTSSSPSRLIPVAPRPPHDRITPLSSAKLPQSLPVKVPMLSAYAHRRESLLLSDADADADADDGEMMTMLPPHEFVARSLAQSPRLSSSVLEGAGRTLKGRDLRQVRNAVFRQTGFLD